MPRKHAHEARLGYKERVLVVANLPTTGSIVTLKTASEIEEKVAISSEEWEGVDVSESEGVISWSAEKEPAAKSFFFSKLQFELIVKILQDLSEQEKLRREMLPLWDKFIG